jgi:cell division protein FtsA
MKKKPRITALDVSDVKIAGIIAELESDNKMTVLGYEVVNHSCLENGIVMDIAQAASNLKDTIKRLQDKTHTTTSALSINIAGKDLNLSKSEAAILISNARGIITTGELKTVIDQAHIQGISLDRKVIETLISKYTVDDNIEVINPLRMHAKKLNVQLSAISGLTTHINNIKKAVNRAGYFVKDMVADAIADSYSVLLDSERESGAVLINIGSSLTQVSVYKSNRILYLKTFNKGGSSITEVIASSLGVSFAYAEELKKRYGCGQSYGSDKQEVVLKNDDGTFKTISRDLITDAVSRGLFTVFDVIVKDLKMSEINFDQGYKIIITGGLALMDSVIEVLQTKYNLSISIGVPRGYSIANELVSPGWSTCLGVAKKSLISPPYIPAGRSLSIPRYIAQKFNDFLIDYF